MRLYLCPVPVSRLSHSNKAISATTDLLPHAENPPASFKTCNWDLEISSFMHPIPTALSKILYLKIRFLACFQSTQLWTRPETGTVGVSFLIRSLLITRTLKHRSYVPWEGNFYWHVFLSHAFLIRCQCIVTANWPPSHQITWYPLRASALYPRL